MKTKKITCTCSTGNGTSKKTKYKFTLLKTYFTNNNGFESTLIDFVEATNLVDAYKEVFDITKNLVEFDPTAKYDIESIEPLR